MVATIENVIRDIPGWADRHVRVEPIAAGLTNRNYRVEIDGDPFFVRIPGAATELLAVDRGNELQNTRAAAEAGVGPRVLYHLPQWDVLVLTWIPAATMTSAAMAAPGQPGRVADALRRLHAGPRFRDDFDMFRLAERYLELVDERAIPIPTGYRDHLGRLRGQIQDLLQVASRSRRSCRPRANCENDRSSNRYARQRESSKYC